MLGFFYGIPLIIGWLIWAAIHWLTDWAVIDYLLFGGLSAGTAVAIFIALLSQAGPRW